MTNKKPIHAKPSLYAYYFDIIKSIGLSYGYNIVLHGSLNRDLDLIAIAWQEQLGDVDEMIDKIAENIGGSILMQNSNTENPEGERCSKTHHGRKQYVVNINRRITHLYEGMSVSMEWNIDPVYYIDISVI